MKGKKRGGIIFFFILLIVISAGVIANFEVNKNNNLPSQCYTDLQPSKFLTRASVSPITINSLDKYFKIDTGNYDVFSIVIQNTGSMRPTISDNSEIVLIKPKSEKDINIGDIVQYECGCQLILHRVIDIQNNTYITKGDNNNIDDSAFNCPVKFENIKGKVIAIVY